MNASSALTAVIADELYRCGVRDVVLAPGARSSPLAQALYAQAQRSQEARPWQRLRLHVRFDERSAAYMALGLARVSGRPIPVICTSGTAAANLFPALLEARHSHLPLMAVTTDRPPELRGIGASQVTDQIKMYGAAVQSFTEIGTPRISDESNGYWRSLTCRAVMASAGGPVHLNMALGEPLTFDPGSDWRHCFPGRADGTPWIDAAVADDVPGPAPGALRAGPRGIVIAGDEVADPSAVVAFAEAAGWPLLAEPHSNARHGPRAVSTYVHLLSHPGIKESLKPEVIVSVGRPGVSRELLSVLGPEVFHTVVDPHPQWADPTRTATRRVRRLALPPDRCADPWWLKRWKRADQVARAALDAFLDQSGLNEPRLARDLLTLIPDDSLCLIGSSMPIRDAEATMRPRRGPQIIANRGLAGIDGTVSTAIGATLAHQRAGGGKGYALLGDLTFLHDSTGLMIGRGQQRPDLTLVVANNGGGGIFSLVDYTAGAEGFEELFGTPHDVDIGRLASATGWRYTAAKTAEQLHEPLAWPGPGIIEVQTDRDENTALHRALRSHVHAALDAHAG